MRSGEAANSRRSWAGPGAGEGHRARRAYWCAAPIALAWIGLGCSRGDGFKTYPVTGRVIVNGEPASGAFLVFHPVAAATGIGNKPTAQVKPDGTFELTTVEGGDGAPSGDYAVTLEWRKLIQAGGEPVPGPNIVPQDYSLPQTTPLKVTVKEDANQLEPFRIDASRRR